VCDLILPRGLAFRTFKHHMYLCPDGPSRAAISEGPGFTCRYSLVEILVSEDRGTRRGVGFNSTASYAQRNSTG
jgi:hypothetical protein